MQRLHQDEQVHEQAMLDLDEIARQGARRMLAEALEAEVADYIEAARGQPVSKIAEEEEALLAFYDYPAQH